MSLKDLAEKLDDLQARFSAMLSDTELAQMLAQARANDDQEMIAIIQSEIDKRNE